ncbi:MAG: hypothetical protein RR203_02590 [Synergistaceae bacterium]
MNVDEETKQLLRDIATFLSLIISIMEYAKSRKKQKKKPKRKR